MINRRICGIAVIVSLALLVVPYCPASALPRYFFEEFYGENELAETLPIKERQTYYALRYLMNRFQRKQFLLLETPEQRAVWIERFWKELDPTPTTRKNERKIEHERRVREAYVTFFRRKPPGWDRRGEILIRFGLPDYKEKTWAHIGTESRMPGEIWYYNSLGFLVSFVDEFLNGDYTYLKDHYSFDYLDFMRRENLAHDARSELQRIESAIKPSSEPITATQSPQGKRPHKDIYLIEETDFHREENAAQKDLEDLGNIEEPGKPGSAPIMTLVLPQHMDPRFEDPIYAFNPDFIDHYAVGYLSRQKISQAEMNRPVKYEYYWADKAADNFFMYLKERPFLHTCDRIEQLLPTFFDVNAFRGGAGILRTEVNFEVPANEVEFRKTEGAYRAGIDLTVRVSDYQMNDVDFAHGEIVASKSTEEDLYGVSLLPGQVILSLEPGYYRLAVEAVDRRTGKRGGYTTNLELGCLDTCLALSDIQFASRIRETEEGGHFVKGNLEVIPHPLHAYRKPYPLTFYFEIYGLDTDPEGLAFYTVEYSIIPLEKKRWGPVLKEIKTAVSSKFRTTHYGSTQAQRLEIATDDLWKGAFMLNVTVTDRRTFEVVQKSARFSILE